jgi:hypothetical protein
MSNQREKPAIQECGLCRNWLVGLGRKREAPHSLRHYGFLAELELEAPLQIQRRPLFSQEEMAVFFLKKITSGGFFFASSAQHCSTHMLPVDLVLASTSS